MLATNHLTLAEFKQHALEDILNSVWFKRQSLTVQLSPTAEIVIQPKPQLKPLPVLEGYVPTGWKEGIYDEPK
jgi:hypothetical protein